VDRLLDDDHIRIEVDERLPELAPAEPIERGVRVNHQIDCPFHDIGFGG
jgi:hypothetical protein